MASAGPRWDRFPRAGEVPHYVVTAAGNDVTELRTVHDWIIRPKMRTVKGAAEVNTWGGYEKQFQIRVDPNLLIKFGLTFDDVVRSAQENNRNVGAGTVRQGTQSVLVQGLGRTTNIDQIKGMVITAKDGVPVRIGDIGEVMIGSEIRRGASRADGRGEVVMGLLLAHR
jgi:cobalt-zinc-cadmium resistance protein CzcA